MTVIEYINDQPSEFREKLEKIREVILETSKDIKEKISWNMPTFYTDRPIFHFAFFKNHIGLYPGPDAIEHFKDKISKYKSSKGAIQIPNTKEMPFDLIVEMVKYNLESND